jgi:hypothetical protein
LSRHTKDYDHTNYFRCNQNECQRQAALSIVIDFNFIFTELIQRKTGEYERIAGDKKYLSIFRLLSDASGG